MTAEVIQIGRARRLRADAEWERQRQRQIGAGRARLRRLLGIDGDDTPPRAA